MDQITVLRILREHAEELRRAGVLHLDLFGSVARSEQRHDSDVDLLAEFQPERNINLIGIGSIQQKLSHILQQEVDLSSAAWMRDHVRQRALAEAVRAF